MMKKILRIILCFYLLMFFVFVVSAQSLSKWQPSVLKIDGDVSDWITTPRFFNSSSMIQYELRNDAKYLYVVIQTSDRTNQMQMKSAGFEIQFKTSSVKQLRASMKFIPLMLPGVNDSHLEGREERDLRTKQEQHQFKIPNDSVVLDGFIRSKGSILSGNIDSARVSFSSLRSRSRLLCYEMQIPLNDLYGNNYFLNDISKETLEFQVIINAMSKANKPTFHRQRGGMNSRMSGGMHGEIHDNRSEMENFDMSGADNEREQPMLLTMTKKSFKTEFYLSKK